jgi:hypothetical protein
VVSLEACAPEVALVDAMRESVQPAIVLAAAVSIAMTRMPRGERFTAVSPTDIRPIA